MYTSNVNGTAYRITEVDNQIGIDDKKLDIDLLQINENTFHILKDNASYNVDVIKINTEEKTVVLKVNGNKYEVKVTDKFDELLKSLGMDSMTLKKVNNIKAPMPGLVLNIIAKEGDEVKKGDALLVLEAMKMENILKSPTDGVIKKIAVQKGVAVEKNQLLIEF